MTTLIKSHRAARSMTLRQLADRLGVTASAVQQYESAEESGNIKVKTLERVLAALGVLYSPAVETMPTIERREELLNLALHREVAKKLIDSPHTVLQVARANIPKIRANVAGPGPAALIREWENLISAPTNMLIAAMLDESRRGSELRQNTPFAGVLSQDERLRVLAGVSR